MIDYVKPLGTWTDSEKRHYYIIEGAGGIIHRVGKNKLLKIQTLLSIARLGDWVAKFRSDRARFDYVAAADYLIAKCIEKGPWIEPREFKEIPEERWKKIKPGQWFRAGKADYDDYKFYIERGSTAKGDRGVKGLEHAIFKFEWCDDHGEIERVS